MEHWGQLEAASLIGHILPLPPAGTVPGPSIHPLQALKTQQPFPGQQQPTGAEFCAKEGKGVCACCLLSFCFFSAEPSGSRVGLG